MARWVSDVFSPPVLAIAMAVAAAVLVEDPRAWRFVLVFVGIGILAPVLDVLWLLRMGRIADFHLTQRHERIRPFAVSTAATAVATGVLWWGGAPRLMVMLGVAALAQTVLLFALTLGWKVSVHAAATGALAALVAMGWGMTLAGLMPWLLVPLVGWARVRLRRHTPAQVVVGVTIGATTMLLAMRGVLWG
jgi:membrane-associated phospholipid phosphatase